MGTTTIDFRLDIPLAPADLPLLCDGVRMLLESCDADAIVCDLSAVVHPDAVTVDALARLQLTARRLGREVRLHDASSELLGLVSLMGLADVLRE
jgi:ABC-type transporter Mla MlaB component